MGGCLRRLREHAPLAIALFPLLFLPKAVPLACDSDGGAVPAGTGSETELRQSSADVHAAIDRWGLRGCYNWKPLINGAEVRSRAWRVGHWRQQSDVGVRLDCGCKQALLR